MDVNVVDDCKSVAHTHIPSTSETTTKISEIYSTFGLRQENQYARIRLWFECIGASNESQLNARLIQVFCRVYCVGVACLDMDWFVVPSDLLIHFCVPLFRIVFLSFILKL